MVIKIKNKAFLIFLLIFCKFQLYGQNTSRKDIGNINDALSTQKQMLKNYFLCSCIDYSFRSDSLFYKDHSLTVYSELLNFKYDDIQNVKKYAKEIAEQIQISNYSNNRGVFFTCIEHYQGKKLDKMIRRFKLQD